jgi:hypothetical protein
MKYVYSLVALCLIITTGHSQTVLFSEDFEGVSQFTLNTTDVGSSGTAENFWQINNVYAGGSGTLICLGFPFGFTVINTPTQPGGITNSPTSSYLHTTNNTAQSNGILCSSFAAADGLCLFSDNIFSRMNPTLNTTAYEDVTLSFWWNCGGGTNIYGEVYYSTNGGTTWTLITTPISQYKNQLGWTQQSISLPAFANQTSLKFGFRFVNQVSGSATDPGFSLDDIVVTGTNSLSTGPLVSNSLCLEEVISVDYSSSATFNAGNLFFVELSNAAGSFAAPTVIGAVASQVNTGSIAATIPLATPVGSGYRVRVTSSQPAMVGSDNGDDISITDCANSGCTDSLACNFDSTALSDDGSCVYDDCYGCTDTAAWNYDSTATFDDGCCFYLDTVAICGDGTIWSEALQQCVIYCQADLNYDGFINTQDLLAFLASFGGTCD